MHTQSHAVTHTCVCVCVREKMCRCGFTPKNHVAQNANDQNIARGYIDTEKPISYAVIQIFGMPNQNATHHISVEIVVVFSIPQFQIPFSLYITQTLPRSLFFSPSVSRQMVRFLPISNFHGISTCQCVIEVILDIYHIYVRRYEIHYRQFHFRKNAHCILTRHLLYHGKMYFTSFLNSYSFFFAFLFTEIIEK